MTGTTGQWWLKSMLPEQTSIGQGNRRHVWNELLKAGHDDMITNIICQSIEEVYLTGVAPLGTISQRF